MAAYLHLCFQFRHLFIKRAFSFEFGQLHISVSQESGNERQEETTRDSKR